MNVSVMLNRHAPVNDKLVSLVSYYKEYVSSSMEKFHIHFLTVSMLYVTKRS